MGAAAEIKWLELLRGKVKEPGASMGSVATDLQMSRTTVSLVLSGKYPASTDKIAARVMQTYGRVECPFLREEISGAQCADYHQRPAPTSSPFAMRHWRACQGCPNRRST